jgi:hypothetical protein
MSLARPEIAATGTFVTHTVTKAPTVAGSGLGEPPTQTGSATAAGEVAE